MEKKGNDLREPQNMKSLVVMFSYHHNNTEKIAKTIAAALGAEVKTPQQVTPGEVAEYDLVGFGSGIYSAQNDPSVIALAEKLPPAGGRKAFIFSTYGAPEALFPGERLRAFVLQNHARLRETLQSRGYAIAGEFGCAGWNTNSFLKYFGGLNKGRPDADDLRNAEAFARNLVEKAGE